eukprot:11895222-Alexandrium_andersonii.AAC.1
MSELEEAARSYHLQLLEPVDEGLDSELPPTPSSHPSVAAGSPSSSTRAPSLDQWVDTEGELRDHSPREDAERRLQVQEERPLLQSRGSDAAPSAQTETVAERPQWYDMFLVPDYDFWQDFD